MGARTAEAAIVSDSVDLASSESDLLAGFRGEVVHPHDPSYEEHRRVWNGAIDRRPALIARCAGVADVISAVKLARRTGLRVAVRIAADKVYLWPPVPVTEQS